MSYKIWLWLARRMPLRLRYWVVISEWAKATTGQWSGEEAPALRVSEMTDRMK